MIQHMNLRATIFQLIQQFLAGGGVVMIRLKQLFAKTGETQTNPKAGWLVINVNNYFLTTVDKGRSITLPRRTSPFTEVGDTVPFQLGTEFTGHSWFYGIIRLLQQRQNLYFSLYFIRVCVKNCFGVEFKEFFLFFYFFFRFYFQGSDWSKH